MEDAEDRRDAANGGEGGQHTGAGVEEPHGAAEEGEEVLEPGEGIGADPLSVFEELGAMQAEARRDDTKTIELLPGRFKGRLAVRVRRIDPKKRKRKARKIAKRGVTDEAELQYAAEVIAESTDAILYRPKDDDKLVEAQTLSDDLGVEPVRWDARLGKMLKMEDQLSGSESPAAIVRLVFRNPEALDAFYQELDLWLREAAPDEDDEDEGDTQERPT